MISILLIKWSTTKMVYPFDPYYLLLALVTPFFPRIFIIKGKARNKWNPPSPFPTLIIPFPVIAFFNEEGTGCIIQEVIGAINEAAIGATTASRNWPSCVFLLCVTVFASFGMKKVSPFLALATPLLLIFISSLLQTKMLIQAKHSY